MDEKNAYKKLDTVANSDRKSASVSPVHPFSFICLVVQCGRLSVLNVGMIYPDNSIYMYIYNSTIRITCKAGYKLQGSDTAVCGRNGDFIFQHDPSCHGRLKNIQER